MRQQTDIIKLWRKHLDQDADFVQKRECVLGKSVIIVADFSCGRLICQLSELIACLPSERNQGNTAKLLLQLFYCCVVRLSVVIAVSHSPRHKVARPLSWLTRIWWGVLNGKAMKKQHFKLTTKLMGCNESLFPHEIFKSLGAAVQSHCFSLMEREVGSGKSCHCFRFSMVCLSYQEFTLPVALSKCENTFLLQLPCHEQTIHPEGTQSTDQYCCACGGDYNISPQNWPIYLFLAITENTQSWGPAEVLKKLEKQPNTDICHLTRKTSSIVCF